MSDFPDKILDAWSNHDWDAVAALHHDDYQEHLSPPDFPPGLEGLNATFNLFTTAFPDIKFERGATVISDDKISYHWIGRGTHKGDFMGMPATGKKFELNGMTILTEVDGKCKEAWSVMDMAGLMQQLGAGG